MNVGGSGDVGMPMPGVRFLLYRVRGVRLFPVKTRAVRDGAGGCAGDPSVIRTGCLWRSLPEASALSLKQWKQGICDPYASVS